MTYSQVETQQEIDVILENANRIYVAAAEDRAFIADILQAVEIGQTYQEVGGFVINLFEARTHTPWKDS